MTSNPEPELWQEVFDQTGDSRLQLWFIEDGPRGPRGERGLDFHSLAWETKRGSEWFRRVTIAESEFRRDGPRRRWISKLHNIDSDHGVGTILVGEEDLRNEAGEVHVKYSWREWDLNLNKELRTVKVCKSPLEKFEATPDNGK